jgi:hypothetical protein
MRSVAFIALLVAVPVHAQQAPKPEVFDKFSQWTKSRIAAKSGGAFIARSASDGPAGIRETLQLTATTTAITDEQDQTDYQGAHIAIVGADQAGNVKDVRPVKAGFKTGERFKLRAVSTFGAHLVIENINAKGERKQIYPPEGTSVVVNQAGADTLLPLGEKEFFEFAKTTGEEQLVISLRDPRAVGDAASRQKVFRKDEEFGTHFVQEVAKGAFPVIAEAIKLEHQ